MSSGGGEMDKIHDQFRSTVFPEHASEMKDYYDNVQKTFSKLSGMTIKAKAG